LTEPSDTSDTPAKTRPPVKTAKTSFWRQWMKPHTPFGWIAEAAMVLLLAGGLALVLLRYGPLTTEARLLIESQANGFQLGPFGKLRLQGVRGDVLHTFTIQRLTVSDPKGVWIEADKLAVRWRPGELLFRRLHVQSMTVGQVTIYRQPVLVPQPSAGQPPQINFHFDALKARVLSEPAFSQTRAIYDVTGRFEQQAGGRTVASLDMRSVLRPGDFLTLNLDLGAKNSLKLDADAREVGGGGIAGSLGLAADQPFVLSVHLSGATSNGRFNAIARSGADTPLTAQGAWTPNGGQVDGRLMLEQSRWTKGWANAFGPQAQIALSAKRRDKANYDLDAHLQTDNLSLAAHGPADIAKRSSSGLAVNLIVNNLAKVVPQPVMGRGEIDGVLSGSFADLHMAGQAQMGGFEFLGYRLARVAGPMTLTWRGRQLTILASANGSGASGSGMVAAAGGPAPTGRIEIDGLADGRVLIRSMSIIGKTVRIDGAGGQNLLGGGLTFKGQMAAPDMAALRPGASGTFQADWSADQSKAPGAPWTFTLQAHGAHFATGQSDLDQLLGAQPSLTGHAGFVGDTISFDKVSLTGAKAQANAQGQWKLDGTINFGLGWQADGPFSVGPLEVDGKAQGQGTLTGALGAPKLDLQSRLAVLNLPNLAINDAKLNVSFAQAQDGVDGHIDLGGQSEYGLARAASDFRFPAQGMELSGLDVDAGGVRAQGQLVLLDTGLSTADLTFAIAPGAVLSEGNAAGRISMIGGQGATSANLEMTATGAVLRGQAVALSTAKITARGPLARLPYQVSADGAVAHAPLKLNGSGVFTADPKGFQASFEGSGQLRRSDFHTLEPVQLRMDDNDQFARLRLALGGGQAQFDGEKTAGAATVKALLTNVDLSFLSEDFTGQFDAGLELTGKGKDLHGVLAATLKNAHSRDAREGLSIDGQVKAQLQDERLSVQSTLRGGQGLTSSADFVLPADASAAPFRLAVARDRPMQGHFEANGEIQPLWDLFLGGERSLGGSLAAKADFSGTVADPRITGRADLTGGRFEDYPTGLKLRDATIGASLNTDTIVVDKFSASDNQKGSITGEGQVSLARGGASNLQLQLNNFRLVDNDTATANTTGALTIVRGADGKAKITGALEVVSGDINAAAKTNPDIPTIDVVEKNRPFNLQEQLQLPPNTQPGVVLDISLTAPRGLLVKGRGLNLDMSLDATVTGTSAKPILSGEARVVRGDYDFGGQRFAFDNRGTVQLSNDPKLIRLNLTATRDDPSLTAVINIQGTAAKPQITLSSTPVLPNDEVLSQVLFGASASQLSPLQAAQLASAVTALASGGGFDVIGGLRSFARLDRLALVGGGTTGVSVAGGKYIGDKVYVQVAGGGRDGPSAEVEYRITHNLSLASRLANIQPAASTNTTPGTVVQTGSTISIRWRRDFRDKPPKAPAKPAAVKPAN
jgi:translocation and assembly module TamB